MAKMAQIFLMQIQAEDQRMLIERLKASGAGDEMILKAQNQLAEIEMKLIRLEADLPASLPPIPAHPLKARRERVRELIIAGDYTEAEMAKEMKEPLENVRNDKKWLKRKGLLP